MQDRARVRLALLSGLRNRGGLLTAPKGLGRTKGLRRAKRVGGAERLGRRSVGLLVAIACLTACEPTEPELLPDERLRAELGLTDDDRVHTVELRTGTSEQARPDSVDVRPGDLVQFVTADWLVHEVRFSLDSLDEGARAFLLGSGQEGSPPLLQRDARFVLTFENAPPGRYPYALLGNREPGRGVIVVAPTEGR